MENKEKLRVIVVMLSTEKAIANGIIKHFSTNNLSIVHKDIVHIINDPAEAVYIPQHLYFASDREIKEGDWMLHILDKTPIKYYPDDYPTIKHASEYEYRKIEATTDSSMNIPLIPQSFIEKYVESQGEIKEVMIEMEERWSSHNKEAVASDGGYYNKTVTESVSIIKLRKDNTVIVHKVKDSWTREEHCMDMQYYMEYCQSNEYITPIDWLDNHKHY